MIFYMMFICGELGLFEETLDLTVIPHGCIREAKICRVFWGKRSGFARVKLSVQLGRAQDSTCIVSQVKREKICIVLL